MLLLIVSSFFVLGVLSWELAFLITRNLGVVVASHSFIIVESKVPSFADV